MKKEISDMEPEDKGKNKVVEQTQKQLEQQKYGTFQGVANYPSPLSRPDAVEYPPLLSRQGQPGIGLPQPAPPPGYAYQSLIPGYPLADARHVEERRLPCCGIGFGWFLFLSGFVCGSIPWYIGAFVLLCARVDYREKPGLIACTLAAILAFVAVTLGVTKVNHAW